MRKQPLTEALLRANLNLVLLPAATKLGQGNIFTRCVCPQGGSGPGGGFSNFSGGLQFSGGFSNFWGSPIFRGCPIFQGVSNFLGVSNILGGLQFSGGVLQFFGGFQFFGGVSNFSGGLQMFFLFFSIFSPQKFFWGAPTPPLDGQCVAGTHPTGMYSC